MSVTRRFLLSGALSAVASAGFANAPATSLRPQARAGVAPPPISEERPRARQSLTDMIRQAGLGGIVGFTVIDPQSGDVIVDVDGAVPQPPASVTKAVTALYALETLGSDHRFRTRVLGTGPIVDGVLQGDLVLAGGGHPNLVTDDLAALVDDLTGTGLTGITGQFLVWGEALPRVFEIDDDQLDHLGYNPSVGGLNLNFNRVHFEWKRRAGDYAVALDARSETLRPAVTTARMRVVDRSTPIYTYRDAAGRDDWTVARRALGEAGSRWLPVRYPAIYAAEVFATLAKDKGITLPSALRSDAPPEGTELARHESESLRALMRSMLRFSTNITAEAAGMAATHFAFGGGFDLDASAARMTIRMFEKVGITPYFEDHSGLGDGSRISARDMVTLLKDREVAERLRPILKQIALYGDDGKRAEVGRAEVRAKTGTLNFVSSLAGYVTTQTGKELVFAFFAADLDARERGKRSADERPAGSVSFNTKAKRLQQRLLRRLILSQF